MALLAEFKTVWSGVAGAPYYATLHKVYSGAVTLQAFADAWEDFLTGMAGTTDNALVAVVSDEVRVIESTTGQTTAVDTISGATVAMTASGDALPPSNQLLVRWNTPNFTNGRRIRGRTFLPGIVEAYSGAVGTPDAGLVSGVASNGNDFITACDGDFVIYSRTHHTYAAVDTCTVWNQWAVLRSRRD